MGKFITALKRGIKTGSASFKPGCYELEGKKVECLHCGGQKFALGTAQLNTTGLTLLNLDWLDKSAYTLMCINCGRIEWFGKSPEPIY